MTRQQEPTQRLVDQAVDGVLVGIGEICIEITTCRKRENLLTPTTMMLRVSG